MRETFPLHLSHFVPSCSHDQLEHIVDRVVAEADTNEDGFISFEEFQAAISKLDIEQKMAFIGFK